MKAVFSTFFWIATAGIAAGLVSAYFLMLSVIGLIAGWGLSPATWVIFIICGVCSILGVQIVKRYGGV